MKNKMKKAAATLIIFAAMTVMMAVPVFAGPRVAIPLNALETMLTNIKNLVVGIVGGIGSILLAIGIFKLGSGILNRDSQAKLDSINWLLGGGIMVLGTVIMGIILAGTGINF